MALKTWPLGSPGEGLGGILSEESSAGAVNVIYGRAGGLATRANEIWHQDRDGIIGGAEDDDSFGSALAAGDFNNDGYEDLAIGVPGEDLEDIGSAGAVNVIYGGPAGLMVFGNQIWHQDSDGIGGVAEPGRQLWSLRWPPVTSTTMALKTWPLEFVRTSGGKEDVGVVNVIYGGPGGLAAVGNQIWGQDSVGIGGGGRRRRLVW